MRIKAGLADESTNQSVYTEIRIEIPLASAPHANLAMYAWACNHKRCVYTY